MRARVGGNARSRRTREALLDSARAVLEKDGFEALTMQVVAEQAGVTRKTVYLHFASRTDLVIELFHHVSAAEGLGESLEQVWAADGAEEALERWADHLAQFHPRILAVARAIEIVRGQDPDAAEHWKVVAADQQECCRRIASWLHREDRLAAPWTVATATDMLWALMSFDMLEALVVDQGWSPRNYGKHILTVLRSTFLIAA